MPHAAAWFGYGSRGVAATPGFFLSDTPWAGVKSFVGSDARTQASSYLSGGFRDGGAAINNESTRDFWFDAGTWKFALLYYKDTNRGIYTVQLDGVSQGTIDGYAAGASANNYTEVTGLVLTKGLKVAKLLAATKNASSTDYYLTPHTQAWVRTGA